MKPLLVIFFTVLLDLVGFGIVIPLLSFYAEDYGASPLEVTALMACYSAAQFLFAPVWGGISDRKGRRPVLLVSIGMASLMLAGFAWASELWLLFLFRTLHGIFAANISTAQAYIADITTPENRAKGMGLIGAGFGLGFTLGPWIGGELSIYGYSTPIWVAAGLSALNFVLAMAFLPESRKPDSTTRPRPINPARLIAVLRHPTVGSALSLSFLMVFSFAMMESVFALFEEHQHGLDARSIGRLLGFIGIVMVVIQGGMIGRLVKRFGEAGLIRVGIPGLGVVLASLAFAPPFAPLALSCLGIAIFQGITQPSVYALISKGASEDEQGFVLGANQSLAALSRAVGPGVAGVMFTTQMQSPLIASGALMLVAGTALAWRATAS